MWSLVCLTNTFSETTAYWIYHSDKTSSSPQEELSNESNFQICIKPRYTQVIKDGIPIVTLLSRTEVNFTSSWAVYIPLILDIVSICAYSIELGWQILWNVVNFKPGPESAVNFARLRHWSNEYCKTQIDLRASRCLLLCSTDASIEYIVQTCPECVRDDVISI